MRWCAANPCLPTALTLGTILLSAQAAATPIPHGTLELVAETQWIAPGHELYLGLHFQLEKGWHIYWVNPGDSGEPPRVRWQLPEGLAPGAMEWPSSPWRNLLLLSDGSDSGDSGSFEMDEAAEGKNKGLCYRCTSGSA